MLLSMSFYYKNHHKNYHLRIQNQHFFNTRLIKLQNYAKTHAKKYCQAVKIAAPVSTIK